MGPAEGASSWRAGWAAEALGALRFNWGDAYEIDVTEDDRWTAIRRDGLGGALAEPGPEELHTAIVADYDLHPVRRP